MTPPRLPSDLGELLDLYDAVRAELQKRRRRGQRGCTERLPRCMGMIERGDCYCMVGVPLPTIGELRERAGRWPVVLRINHDPARRAEVLAAVDRLLAELGEVGVPMLVEVDRGR